MAVKKKDKKVVNEGKEKKSTIFDLISFLTDKKKPWEELSFEEQKMFSPYMINRFLSMELFYAQAINELQKTTLSSMDKKDIWSLYYHLLPDTRVFLKYIKNSIDIPENDINALKLYFKVSKRECEDYWLISQKTEKGKEFLTEIKSNFVYE